MYLADGVLINLMHTVRDTDALAISPDPLRFPHKMDQGTIVFDVLANKRGQSKFKDPVPQEVLCHHRLLQEAR